MAITITGENFDSEVLSGSMPVLVDFWAVWCGPCKMLTPVVDELHAEYEGKAKICKINVDESQELAAKYNVMSIPTVIIFKNGKIAEQFIGVQPKSVYAEALHKHI